jgi:hypothetical protein
LYIKKAAGKNGIHVMDSGQLEATIYEMENLLGECESVVIAARTLLMETRCDLCEEITVALMDTLLAMRQARAPASSVVGLYRSPYTTFTSVEIEEWTPVSGREYTVDDQLARGYCSRNRWPWWSNERPSTQIQLHYKLGPECMMAEKVDPGHATSLLVITPITRASGHMSLSGFTASMEHVDRSVEYSTGWMDAVREIGLF